MVIKKIDLDSIEKYLKNIVETSFHVRLMQEQLEDTINHIKNNENYFKTYHISKNAYEKNKIQLEKQKNILSLRITRSINGLLKNVENLQRKISMNKI